MDWIDRLDRRFGRHAIPHLMYFITGIMLAIYVADLVLGGQIIPMLTFSRSLILQGEVWRVVTFLFLPPNSSPIWILFSLYFYCIIGNGLEGAWGSFRFNVFLPGGGPGRHPLRVPDRGLGQRVSEPLPVSGLLPPCTPSTRCCCSSCCPSRSSGWPCWTWCTSPWPWLLGSWSVRAAVLLALVNILLFFGGPLVRNLKQQAGYWKTRQNFRRNNRRW